MTVVTPRLRLPRFNSESRIARARTEIVRRHRALPRPASYVVLCATVAVLNIVGLVMILSASSVAALSDYGSSWYFFERQLMWATLGCIAFVCAARVDYRRWRKASPFVLATTVAMLVVVLVIGENVKGSRRWLGVGSYGVQPSELAKLALVICAAQVLSVRVDRLSDPRAWRPVLMLLGVFALLIMRQPDLNSTVVLAVITFGVFLPIALVVVIVEAARTRIIAYRQANQVRTSQLTGPPNP